MDLKIGSTVVSEQSDPFVIAEIGNNHQGNLEKCIELFILAKKSGATAVKLQKRNNKKLYTQDFYNTAYNGENSFGETYGIHRDFLEFGEKEYRTLIDLSHDLDLIFFATAFDMDSLNFLVSLKMPAIKIASGDLRSLPLIQSAAQTNIPLIISTGGGEIQNVERVYNLVKQVTTTSFALLQCTASYPAEYEDLNLRVIEEYKKRFPDAIIGVSSHDRGIAMMPVAYTLGARIFEKHFTFDRTAKGTDHAFSLEPLGMEKMIRDLKNTRLALGDGVKKVLESEINPIKKMSKRLVYSQDLRKGTELGEKMIEMRSPGGGIYPDQISNFIGKILSRNVRKGESLTESDI